MSSTVTDGRHRVSDATVKKEPGSFKRAARWALGAQPREDAETPAAREPFTPDAQSRWLLERFKGELFAAVKAVSRQAEQEKPAVASPTDLDGSRPAYLLRRLGMLALDAEIDSELTFGGAVERLQWAWNMLLERAAEESAFARHTPVNAVEAAADGALLGGMPSAARARVVVTDIVGRSLNAPKSTELQVKMTPDVLGRLDAGEPVESVEASVTATAVMSPVHVADGVAAPLPDDADETADPGAHKPLPKRVPHPLTSFPARMNTDGTPIDGTSALAGDLPSAQPGAWLLDENNTWSLITDAALDTDGKRVTTNLAKGLTVSPRCDVRVWLLTADEASGPRSVHEVEMDALECERAGDAA